MAQTFHVLRCFECQTFQVHQVKKTNKWSCKMCGAKQSVKKVYFQGSGKDCRHNVQQLNMMRSGLQEENIQPINNSEIPNNFDAIVDNHENDSEPRPTNQEKWTKYLEEEVNEDIAVPLSDDYSDVITTISRTEFNQQSRRINKSRKPRSRDHTLKPYGRARSTVNAYAEKTISHHNKASTTKPLTNSTVIEQNIMSSNHQRHKLHERIDSKQITNTSRHSTSFNDISQSNMEHSVLTQRNQTLSQPEDEYLTAECANTYAENTPGIFNKQSSSPNIKRTSISQQSSSVSKWSNYLAQDESDDSANESML